MRHYFFSIALVLSLSAAQPAPAQSFDLPEFGDPSQAYLSPDEERRLGVSVLQKLRERRLIVDDVQLNEYLASIGQRIAAYADRYGNPYTFFWVNSGDINAFAAPGGFIGVNAGLLLATQGEDELAGVLAHEIAHVSQRHIARMVAESRNWTIPLAAAILAGILVSQANSELGQAAIAGSLAASSQFSINFTRANELEADRIGARLLIQAGFDPDGMADFFKRLERLSGGSTVPEFLRTHPLPTTRIAETRNRYGGLRRSRTPHDTTAYYLARARIRVLTNTNTRRLIQEFKTALDKKVYLDQTAERYGYAMALKQAGYYDEAGPQIARLLKSAPDRLAFRLEEADLALAMGDREKAWRLFEQLERLYPNDYTLAIHYGQALAIQGDPRKAMRILEPHLQRHGGDAIAHALYARATQRAGDIVQAYISLAEYYYLNGELEQAIEQAELGLKQPKATAYQESLLRARLRLFKEEAKKDKT